MIALGGSAKTNDKLEMLSAYFSDAGDKDKVWVVAIFSGRRPKRTVSSAVLKQWGMEVSGIPQWLFEESYHAVGDLAETLSLLVPEGKEEASGFPLHYYLEKLISLRNA